MEFLEAVFVTPFASIADNPEFLLEVIIGGLLTGVMYSLVALGFVLVYNASGVFNFPQGVMGLLAALAFVGQLHLGLPVGLGLVSARCVVVALAFVLLRVRLRPL